MKKVLAALTAITLLFASCNLQTKEQSQATQNPTTGTEAQSQKPAGEPVTAPNGIGITVLGYSSVEKDMNIVRDLLTKSGFVVSLNVQPDYSSYLTQLDGGNYDLALSGWTTVTGNPDYAVRSLYKSGGDFNRNGMSDERVDELIELASSQTPEVYTDTYRELEKVLVEENGYVIPLYSGLKIQCFNKEVLVPETVHISKSVTLLWHQIEFADMSKSETEPLLLSQMSSSLTSLDPIKGNDGSINSLNTNMYGKIVTLTDDDRIVSEGSLTYEHVIAEGNSEFYFLLKDNVNFAKVENNHAVDSGVRVGAEDVVFTLERAKDKNSVPNHRTYTLHESMKSIEIVTDINVLDSAIQSGTGDTLRTVLEKKAPSAIAELTGDKTQVNNAAGTYQLVKITTVKPFPQVLNYLAHQSAGIVCKEQIEAVNTYDVASYKADTDVAYGDQGTITEGATYNNTLMTSGPYIAVYKNDYEILFERNPGYMPETETAAKIKTVKVKFIKDMDGSISAIRSGDIHAIGVTSDKVDVLSGDPKLQLQELKSNSVTYMIANPTSVTKNTDLRLALLYSINQDDILAVYQNKCFKAYTTLSPLVDTGNEVIADPAKVNEHLIKYWESVNQ